MKRNSTWVLIGALLPGLVVAGCSELAELPAEEAIHIEELESGLKTLTLSARAAERLGIETADAEDAGTQTVVPYASVIYDAQGATWAYVAVEPLSFERESIVVESISGEDALL